MATDFLDCYDAALEEFSDDLAGDFDFLSSSEREGWLAQEWTKVAEGGGWEDALTQTLAKLRQTQLGLVSLESAALAAFSSVVRQKREEPGRSDRALVRASVLETLQEKHTAHLWRVKADVGGLPYGACYGRATWQPAPLKAKGGTLAGKASDAKVNAPSMGAQVTVLPQPTFLADAGPSYFWDGAPSSQVLDLGCGWSTPLRLSLGTFPWVYGHRLQAPAPGLAWRSNMTKHPATVAMRIAAGMWHPEGNLSTDARDVVAAWKHWRATTQPLVSELPTSPKSGEVSRDGERLVATGVSADVVGLNGPRGFICATAYNFIQERFAAFFAMRRALLRSRRHLSPELRELLMTNSDPCVRQQLGVAVLSFA